VYELIAKPRKILRPKLSLLENCPDSGLSFFVSHKLYILSQYEEVKISWEFKFRGTERMILVKSVPWDNVY
jgi:hypothetical protein